MTTPTFVRGYNLGSAVDSATVSLNIDTTGLGANGAVVVFIIGGHVAGNMTGKAFSTPTLGGSTTGWTEQIGETICAPGTTGMMGAWVCLNPTSSASISLALAWTTAVGIGDRIAAVVGLYSNVSANGTAFTADNDGGSSTSDTMTNAPAAGNLTVGSWSHGSAISSITSGTLRGTINNAATDYANGCLAFIEGSTAAFSSASSDTNVGLQVELVATGGAADSTPGPSSPGVGVVGLFGPIAFQWVQQWGNDEVITGSPQTVTAQVADLVLTPVVGTVTAGNATVTAQVATLTLTPVAGVTTGGPTTITAQVATITLTPVVGTVVAGGITGTAQVATLTLTAIPGTVTLGGLTVTAQVATLTLTAIAGTVTGGATTLTAQVGIITLTAIPGSASTSGGAQSVTAQVATLTLTPRAGVVTGGPTSLTAQVATLTLTAVPGTPTPGGLTKTAQIATLALTAVPGTLSSVVTIQAQVALLTLVGRAGLLAPGPTTIQAQIALLTLLGVPGTASTPSLFNQPGEPFTGHDPRPYAATDPGPFYGRNPSPRQGTDPAPVYGRDPTPRGG